MFLPTIFATVLISPLFAAHVTLAAPLSTSTFPPHATLEYTPTNEALPSVTPSGHPSRSVEQSRTVSSENGEISAPIYHSSYADSSILSFQSASSRHSREQESSTVTSISHVPSTRSSFNQENYSSILYFLSVAFPTSSVSPQFASKTPSRTTLIIPPSSAVSSASPSVGVTIPTSDHSVAPDGPENESRQKGPDSLTHSQILAIVIGCLAVVTLGVLLVMRWYSQRRATHSPQSRLHWEHFAPNSRNNASSFFKIKDLDCDDETKYSKRPLLAPDIPVVPSIKLSPPVPAPAKTKQRLSYRPWISLPSSATPRTPLPAYRNKRAVVLDITRDTSQSRFSVTSSDCGHGP